MDRDTMTRLDNLPGLNGRREVFKKPAADQAAPFEDTRWCFTFEHRGLKCVVHENPQSLEEDFGNRLNLSLLEACLIDLIRSHGYTIMHHPGTGQIPLLDLITCAETALLQHLLPRHKITIHLPAGSFTQNTY